MPPFCRSAAGSIPRRRTARWHPPLHIALALVLLGSGIGAILAPGASSLTGGRSATPSLETAAGTQPGVGVSSDTDSNVLSLVPEPASVPSWCGSSDLANRYTLDDAGWVSLQSNLFNLTPGATGGSELCYDNSTGTLSNSISVTTPGASADSVLGFPAAVFGQNIKGGDRGDLNPGLPLPDVRVSNVTGESLWSAVNYSVVTQSTAYNLAFDDWLTQTEANSTLGRNPGPRVEVMVWFADNLDRSWLHQSSVSIPSYVNGSSDPRDWLRDQWCQQNDSQITFDYYYENTANNYSGMTKGFIAVDISAIFANVEQYIASNSNGTCYAPSGTNIGSYYVDEFPLGLEFYPNAKTENETVSWSVNSWCYTLATGTVTGGAVDCNPPGSKTVTPLAATVSASTTSGHNPLDVQLSSNVSGGKGPYSFLWQFGSGLGTNSSPSTNYTYWQPGTYQVNVTVLDFNDIVISKSVTISVSSNSGGGLPSLPAAPTGRLADTLVGTGFLVLIVVVVVIVAVILHRRHEAKLRPAGPPPTENDLLSGPPPGVV
jgi:PKD repeat protein